MIPTGLTRRQWLRAGGAAGMLFPFLRRAARAAWPPPPRLVLLMQSNGTSQANFWPQPPGAPAPGLPPPAPPGLASPILAPLVADPALAAKTTVIKGLCNKSGGAGNGHDQGFAGLYSGYRTVGTFADPWGAGISVDQLLRERLALNEPFPTLNCGVLATDTPVFKAHRRSFSYRGPRQQVPTEIDPYKLYAQMFPLAHATSAGEDPVAAAQRRLRAKRTVLDYVNEDLQALRTRVGAFDRDRLDAHAGSLRTLERRLSATLLPDAARPPRCAAPPAPTAGLDVTAEDAVQALAPLMLDLTALALTCGLTRVVTFQFGNGGEKWYFSWLGINQNSHDDIAHKDDGKTPAVTAKLLKMNGWYAGLVRDFVAALERIPEPGGTALDNSLVVWGNELATGPHTLDDIPVVLLGKAGGRLKRTGYLVDQGPQDYHRLGTPLLNVMGVPALGFGEAPDCGTIAGVEI